MSWITRERQRVVERIIDRASDPTRRADLPKRDLLQTGACASSPASWTARPRARGRNTSLLGYDACGPFRILPGWNLFRRCTGCVDRRSHTRCRAADARGIRDIGCAAGTLAPAVKARGVSHYVGVDISRTAIDAADPAFGEFHVSSLSSFEPDADQSFDAIVFNEVLYYLDDIEKTALELERYSKFLAPDGALIVSMKNDAKSKAILARVCRRFVWHGGILFQEKREKGGFNIRIYRKRPGYLIVVFKKY